MQFGREWFPQTDTAKERKGTNMPTMTKSQRTDPHRPGAIIPEDYTYILSFSAPSANTISFDKDGHLVAGINWEAARDAFYGSCSHGTPFRLALTNCHICGSSFNHGDIWKHTPTGDVIAIGHICAEKYSMLCDRSDWDRERAASILRRERALHRQLAEEGKKETLEANPGLAESLECDHEIVRDIKNRLDRYGELSDAQIALVLKLAREEKDRESDRALLRPAPEGKLTVTGEILSAKYKETRFGSTPKMLLKVPHEDGHYLLWSTIPAKIFDELATRNTPDDGWFSWLRGKCITFTAQISRGWNPNEPHFATANRPSKARLIED